MFTAARFMMLILYAVYIAYMVYYGLTYFDNIAVLSLILLSIIGINVAILRMRYKIFHSALISVSVLSLVLTHYGFQGHFPEESTSCVSNLRQISCLIIMFHQDNGHYPENIDDIKPLINRDNYYCRSARRSLGDIDEGDIEPFYGYSYNSNIRFVKIEDPYELYDYVLLAESNTPDRMLSSPLDIDWNRHTVRAHSFVQIAYAAKGCAVCFADGHARFIVGGDSDYRSSLKFK